MGQQTSPLGGPLNVVGKRGPNIDAVERVTGRAKYTGDLQLPGMLTARILRSTRPHARIVNIDTSKAEQLPGVYAVITREDQKRLGMFGAAYKDQTIVAVDKARYAGDPVAAVAAVDEATAALALRVPLGPAPTTQGLEALLAGT